jgi:SAM-dependent methyltransferase
MLDRLTRSLRSAVRKLQNRDDFDWSKYTPIYSEALYGHDSKGITLVLRPSDFSLDAGKLQLTPGTPPLHPNHKLIYEAAIRLRPTSVLEVGFGGGYHLVNLSQLLPNAEINGCDLLQSQLDLAVSTYPDLPAMANLFVHDITTSPAPLKVDLVFTQTVIMHIQKDRRHLTALRNIFQTSKRHILLMENWRSHNFFADIKRVAAEPGFPWNALHMYLVDDGKQQILVVLSNTRIDGLQPLTRNEELLKYL